MQQGQQIKDIVVRLVGGMSLSDEAIEPIKPSLRVAAPVDEDAEGIVKPKVAESKPGEKIVCEVMLMHLLNRFEELDPTHFREARCGLKITWKGVFVYCELEIHFCDILLVGNQTDPKQHYNFFRRRLAGTVPESELDHLLEEKLLFLVDATGVPVLLSLLVLIFTAGGEDLTKLPSNRIELYELGIDSAISRRLLPGNRTNTDALIHDWLRLFNLDRSAMSATLTEGATEKKEREHRPTRKAALSMELSNNVQEKKMAAEMEAASKKKASEQQSSKGDRKLYNLDSKEVYEVFRYSAALFHVASDCKPALTHCL
jgi:predicted NACHT family NTPase